VRQMLEHFIQYVGSPPRPRPVLCGIAQMQLGEGVWYPMAAPAPCRSRSSGSPRSWAWFRTGVEVTRIETDGRRHGRGDGRGERSPSTGCVQHGLGADLPRARGGRRLGGFPQGRKREAACSGVVLYLGLRRGLRPPRAPQLRLLRDPEVEFGAIYGRASPRPTLPPTSRRLPGRTRASRRGGRGALHPRPHALSAAIGTTGEDAPRLPRVISTSSPPPDGRHRGAHRGGAHLTPQEIHDRYKVLTGRSTARPTARCSGAFKPATARAGQ
jgi:hypothetical protein